jgi:hypothetical protein
MISHLIGPTFTQNWIAVGDFNVDGRLDLTVANYYINNIGLLFGYINGCFGQYKSFSTGAGIYPS